MGVGALPAVLGQIKAGNMRAICIPGSQRIAAAPDIPTSAEQGFPRYMVEGWIGIVGPKGMSPDLVKRLNAAVVSAFTTPEVKEAMAKQGNTINISTPEFAA